MFKKILVPLDCSKYSVATLKAAIEIGKKFNSKITLIHILSSKEEYCRSGITGKVRVKCDVVQVTEEDIPTVCVNLLEKSKKSLLAEDIPVRTILKQGKVVDEILNTIQEGEFDLVIMGARGLGKLKKIFLGSVSSGVIEKASCPVLITKK